MYPNYNYFPQNQQPIRQQPPMQNQGILYLKGRPVSSIEEVKAIPIDFDGSIFIFPDIANKQIYTKQINLDGTASINVYELKILQQPTAQPQMTDYITRDEFNEQMETNEKMVLNTSLCHGGESWKCELYKDSLIFHC